VGELTPRSRYLVEVKTLTATVLPPAVVRLNPVEPRDATVPESLAMGTLTARAVIASVPAWTPVTLTVSPSSTLERLGGLCPGSKYLVLEVTPTAMVVLVAVSALRCVGASVRLKPYTAGDPTVPISACRGTSTREAAMVPVPSGAPVTWTVSPSRTPDMPGLLWPGSM
jgi:hypothetical protein